MSCAKRNSNGWIFFFLMWTVQFICASWKNLIFLTFSNIFLRFGLQYSNEDSSCLWFTKLLNLWAFVLKHLWEAVSHYSSKYSFSSRPGTPGMNYQTSDVVPRVKKAPCITLLQLSSFLLFVLGNVYWSSFPFAEFFYIYVLLGGSSSGFVTSPLVFFSSKMSTCCLSRGFSFSAEHCGLAQLRSEHSV